MKLQAIIRETVEPKPVDLPQSVIVEFVGDKEKQHFEVLFYDFDPYQHKIRKWDTWELTIKWKSDIFIDSSGLRTIKQRRNICMVNSHVSHFLILC